MNLPSLLSASAVLALLASAHGQSAKTPPTPTATASLVNGSFQEGTSGWTLSPKTDSGLSLSDALPEGISGKALKYQREGADSVNSACFSQMIEFKAGAYYRLSFRYKGDGKLAPMVVVRDFGEKPGPRKLFRLKASEQWETYEMEFTMGRTKAPFQVEFYPGSAPHFYLRDNGKANGGRAGEVSFAGIALTETKRIDPPTPTGPLQVRTEKFIYKKTPTTDLALYLDLPVGAKGPVPIVVMIHGGGWVNGSPETMAYRGKFLAQRGIAVARIQYRLVKDGGTFPTTITDVMDSIEWVRQNAKEYDLDLTRVGLTGGSAGGHLSSIAAQRTPECNVYMGYCGLYDALEVGEGLFARKSSFLAAGTQERKEGSALHQIKTPPPATILFHGMADPTIDYTQAVRFEAALKKKGARTELILNEAGGHEVGNSELCDRRLIAFLNREWKLDMKY